MREGVKDHPSTRSANCKSKLYSVENHTIILVGQLSHL